MNYFLDISLSTINYSIIVEGVLLLSFYFSKIIFLYLSKSYLKIYYCFYFCFYNLVIRCYYLMYRMKYFFSLDYRELSFSSETLYFFN